MPSATQGFSGQEILNRVINFVGNNTQPFQQYVKDSIPLAEFKFCNTYQWRFLYRPNLKITLQGDGREEYTLNSTNLLDISSVGYNMLAEDVESMTDEHNGRVVRKVTVKDIRRLDPLRISGSTQDQVTHFAPTQDMNFLVYPTNFPSVVMTIDGYISPEPLLDMSDYPTIPYRYQHTFIEYVIALALDRENDDRAPQKKADCVQMFLDDIRKDKETVGDIDSTRIRHWGEANVDGVGGADLASFYINTLFATGL